MRILVTGITGFVGCHLAPRLLSEGHELLGLACDGPDTAGICHDVEVQNLDLAEGRGITELLQSYQPEGVVHLAAQSAPGLSLSDPVGTFRANVNGTLNLLEAMRRAAGQARLLFVSSSEVYGPSSREPLTESAPLRPVNPYGASKAAAEFLVAQYARSYRLPAQIVRSFPHSGPGQRPLFALPAFARQIARIEAGRQEPLLKVGNLEARRDFLDVSDVVDAYVKLLAAGTSGEVYNLCSGRTYSIQEGLDGLLALAGREIELRIDPDLLRPLDQPILLGSNEKLRRVIDWTPKIGFSEMLERILSDWRRQVSEEEVA